MNMIKVESSNVAAVGYEDGDLHVQFKGGSNVYVYAEVPSELHAEMMKAESVGRFLNQRIKGHYLATALECASCEWFRNDPPWDRSALPCVKGEVAGVTPGCEFHSAMGKSPCECSECKGTGLDPDPPHIDPCPCCDGEGSRLAAVDGYEGMVLEPCPECGGSGKGNSANWVDSMLALLELARLAGWENDPAAIKARGVIACHLCEQEAIPMGSIDCPDPDCHKIASQDRPECDGSGEG